MELLKFRVIGSNVGKGEVCGKNAGELWNGYSIKSKARRAASSVAHRRIYEAIAAGGSTLQDFSSTDGSEGAYQQRFAVYDRAGEKCQTPGCRGTIRRIVQSGRSTFYCPSCQK